MPYTLSDEDYEILTSVAKFYLGKNDEIMKGLGMSLVLSKLK